MPANKKKSRKRASVETVNAEVAVINIKLEMIGLRVQHAIERTGLVDLLSPALVDIDVVVKCVAEISTQVTQLVES